MTTPIECLPEILLENVLGFLSMKEGCYLLRLSRRLWAVKEVYEQRQRRLDAVNGDDGMLLTGSNLFLPGTMVAITTEKKHPSAWPRQMFQNLSIGLHTLDLSFYCTDWFLQLISEQQLFPLLQHIAMQRSPFVTDVGLHCLSLHTPAEGGGIETIDITFCHNTSYGGTFCLRDRLRNSLRLIRRQPPWLDGKFHTPFNKESEEVEVHTYYADGSFSFNREHQSRGFVSELREWDGTGEYLADKLQYTNFEPLVGWPTWTTYSYRPGVCLLKLPDQVDPQGGETIRTILVGQNLRGLRPPKVHELMQQNSSLTVGTSTYFIGTEQSGTLIQTRHRPATGGIMISKMRVYPLDSLMPPADLVADCRLACEVMRDLGEDVVDSGENYLNDALA